MPSAQIASKTGPIELYYEDTGRGFPLIWCHEFGGDYRRAEMVKAFVTSIEYRARFLAPAP